MGLLVRGLTILFVPEQGGTTRTIRLSGRSAKLLLILGGFLSLMVLGMATSWLYLAFQAARAGQLQVMVDSLQEERTRLIALAEEVVQVEQEYEHLRSLFGLSEDAVASNLWLPPSGLPGTSGVNRDLPLEEHLPTSWPLTEPGYVTQTLFEGDEGDHPGLDIAVPTGSYVRAAGAGRVVRIGEDPVYGFFVVIDHGEGYQTVYAHASEILVERGQSIRRNQVIALSGSTGRSTAPHLHFEILLDGEPLDPLAMLKRPA